ncbi:MAG: Uma2 family endonuclease, partial [Methylobacteriaceae bacterium]|nr:Uma2 family endonuclease [Methylobacteriaceae bacterium]
MNIALPRKVPTTRAAEGFDRRAFTVAECLRMQELGIIDSDERYELIEGEIVPMQSKNYGHERIKLALIRMLARTLPDHLQLGVETSAYLS